MPDPTLPVRRALRHLTERTAMRLEVAMLRRSLTDARDDLQVYRLLVAMEPFAPPPQFRITPTAPRLLAFAPRASMPAPRPIPEGVPRAARPRPLRRRP